MGAFICSYTTGGITDRLYDAGSLRSAEDGHTFFERCDRSSANKAGSFWATVLGEGAAVDWSLTFAGADGSSRRMRVFAVLIDDSVLVVAVDDPSEAPSSLSAGRTLDELSAIVNELSIVHRQAAKSAARMRLAMEAERAAREQSEELQRRLRFLANAAHQCAESTANIRQFLETVLDLAVPALGDFCVITAFVGQRKLSRARHADAALQPALTAMVQKRSFDTQALSEISKDGFSLPLGNPKSHQATMFIGNIAREATNDERLLAQQFATIVSVCLDNALLYDDQRSISEELQRALLPTELPASPHFILDAIYKPSGGGPEYMGGDWYDAFMLPDGTLAISIGDVTGHGVYAAVAMGKARQAIRTSALSESNPVRVLQNASRLLFFEHIVATALFGRLDVQSRSFSYAISGHPPPVLSAGGAITLLPYGGTPLGLDEFENAGPVRFDVILASGDAIVFYTDGLIEQHQDINVGLEQLVRSVVHIAREPLGVGAPKKLVQEIIGDAVAADDVAVLCLHMTG